jgi:hypothetical protein
MTQVKKPVQHLPKGRDEDALPFTITINQIQIAPKGRVHVEKKMINLYADFV